MYLHSLHVYICMCVCTYVCTIYLRTYIAMNYKKSRKTSDSVYQFVTLTEHVAHMFIKCSFKIMGACMYDFFHILLHLHTPCSLLARINELRSMHSSDVGQQVDKIRMQEQDWAGREQEYRKRIQQLEAKVGVGGCSGKALYTHTHTMTYTYTRA